METLKINGVELPEPFHRSSQVVQLPLGEKIFGAYTLNLYQGHGSSLTRNEAGEFTMEEMDYPLIVITEAAVANAESSGIGVPLSWFFSGLVAPKQGELGALFKMFGESTHVLVALDKGTSQSWKEFYMAPEKEQPKGAGPHVERDNPAIQEYMAKAGTPLVSKGVDFDSPEFQAVLQELVKTNGNFTQDVQHLHAELVAKLKGTVTLTLHQEDRTADEVKAMFNVHEKTLDARYERLEHAGLAE
ncbi:MAG: hypothetical protein ACP5OR_04740 [Candidatus Dormibacteria bacterium]